MKTHTSDHLSCSQCHFFQPEGRYHGSCSRMSVTVRGEWPACSLVSSAFARVNSRQPVAA